MMLVAQRPVKQLGESKSVSAGELGIRPQLVGAEKLHLAVVDSIPGTGIGLIEGLLYTCPQIGLPPVSQSKGVGKLRFPLPADTGLCQSQHRTEVHGQLA